MRPYHHQFIIPVMGTGHSSDTPIRVAPFGISSVISLVDDMLLEQLRKHYAAQFDLPYTSIPRKAEDGRARRITAYLDTVHEIVGIKLARIKALPFFEDNDKAKYFEMLPEESPLKGDYRRLLALEGAPEAEGLARSLTAQMVPGSIDVNIMVKLDRINYQASGQPLSDEFNDALAALRGFANSVIEAGIVFSAGINRSLYNYIASFRDFYRNTEGDLKKRIIIKVSDFRSALVQGMFLARNGLEVSEYRVESGLNCGGHAFASSGFLLPTLMEEFREKRAKLVDELRPMIQRYYTQKGWEYPAAAADFRPLLTVQGGIGVSGEARRLRETFSADQTGWGSPFLLVPEATPIDAPTLELVRAAKQEDLYLSDVSPLGVPFNNLRNTGSERDKEQRIRAGKPGSPCPKGHAVTSFEFSEQAMCISSREYQALKLAKLEEAGALTPEERRRQAEAVMERACLCHQLGNGVLIALGIVKEKHAPQAICPGPNVAWFDRIYTLREMVDHIYGRIPSLVPEERPHMFANELELYVKYYRTLVDRFDGAPKQDAFLREFGEAIEKGMEDCLRLAALPPYPGENLASIPPIVARERVRLAEIRARLEQKIEALQPAEAMA